MSSDGVIIQGTVKPDGSLELDRPVSLAPGRVQVTMVPLPAVSNTDSFLARMQTLWQGQQTRGNVARSAEEVKAERQAMREEWEQRMQRVERVQAEAEAIRRRRGERS